MQQFFPNLPIFSSSRWWGCQHPIVHTPSVSMNLIFALSLQVISLYTIYKRFLLFTITLYHHTPEYSLNSLVFGAVCRLQFPTYQSASALFQPFVAENVKVVFFTDFRHSVTSMFSFKRTDPVKRRGSTALPSEPAHQACNISCQQSCDTGDAHCKLLFLCVFFLFLLPVSLEHSWMDKALCDQKERRRPQFAARSRWGKFQPGLGWAKCDERNETADTSFPFIRCSKTTLVSEYFIST